MYEGWNVVSISYLKTQMKQMSIPFARGWMRGGRFLCTPERILDHAADCGSLDYLSDGQDVVIAILLPGGPAAVDGRLRAGDVVVLIDGASIGGHPSVQVCSRGIPLSPKSTDGPR